MKCLNKHITTDLDSDVITNKSIRLAGFAILIVNTFNTRMCISVVE